LRVDRAVVNAENASHGFGLSPDMARTPFVIGLEWYIVPVNAVAGIQSVNPCLSEAREPPRGHLQPFRQAALYGLHPGS